MTSQRRLAAGILAALVLLAVAASLFVITQEADHDCVGEDCPVCAVIASCRKTLKALCGILIAAALLFASSRLTAALLGVYRVEFFHETPILLRVKLLN